MPQLFEKGDVVMLKSGGPKMTIEEYKLEVGLNYTRRSDHSVYCAWFDTDNKLQTKVFEQEALRKIEE